MTARNGLVQPEGAYLLTDGAVLDRDKKIVAIGGKVLVLPEAQTAIAWNGFGVLHEIENGLRDRKACSQTEVLAALPTVLQDMAEGNSRMAVAEGLAHPPPINLLIALWHVGEGQGQLWALHSDAEIFGPTYLPFTLVRLLHALETLPEQQRAVFGRLPNFSDPASFNVSIDGLKLLEAQRREPWEDGHYAVGGFAHLTSVSACGVSQEVLRWWPDVIGKPISPAMNYGAYDARS